MIFSKTILNVVDNSGVRFVKCLKVIKATSSLGRKTEGFCGDIILVSVRLTKSIEKIKKGSLLKALIVKTIFHSFRVYGKIGFNKNAVILLNKKNEPLGNRIFGVISRESLDKNFVKFESIKLRDV